MNRPAESSWTRRARPLLGTIVEVTLDGPTEAANCAFAAIEAVQMRMSYHDPASELSALNRGGAEGWVKISEDLLHVLQTALRLAQDSGGAFDPTVAPRLTSLGFLPSVPGSPAASGTASWRDIEIDERGSRVRFHRALRIDLGGIAKGYAVDWAVSALSNEGVAAGIVNAGGDLRVFGSANWSVDIRHPEQASLFVASIPLNDCALATSAGTFSRRRRGGKQMTALLDGRTRVPLPVGTSVSVIAPNAIIADGLTKVVLALGKAADSILAHHEASAFLFDSMEGARFVPAFSDAA